MEQKKVDMFIIMNGKNLPEQQLPLIKEKLLALDDSQWSDLCTIQFKNPIIALLFSLLFGGLGIDRFYIGDIGLGIGKLLTCGGFGIWTIVDWLLILQATRDRNYLKLQTYLQ